MPERSLLITVTSNEALDHFVRPQLPYLLDAGWQITTVSGEANPTQIPRTKQIVLPMTRDIAPTSDIRAWRGWVSLLRTLEPEIIFGSTPKAGLLSMSAGYMVGVPRRLFLHRGARWETMTGVKRRLVFETDRVTLGAATHNLAVSPSLADLIASAGLADRPTVLGNGGSKGVNTDRFRPLDREQVSAPTLGYLGRLHPDKGLDVVIQAYRHLRRSMPATQLLVGGKLDSSNPLPDSLLRQLEEDPGIQLLGQVSDTPRFLNEIDLLLFPSSREGLPNVVIEAAACGTPTIAWDVTGVRDAVSHGVTGELIDPGNGSEFFRACERWVVKHPTTIENCRSWGLRFSEKTLAESLVSYLEYVHES